MEYKTNKNLSLFVKAFQERLHRTPDEYINEKLATGSKLDAVRYVFDIQAAAISQVNNCKFYDFYYFYNRRRRNSKQTPPEPRKGKRPENAGAKWSTEDEQLLVKMYKSGATKQEMCDRFKRTETGLAARLVHLGVIKDRDTFRNRK